MLKLCADLSKIENSNDETNATETNEFHFATKMKKKDQQKKH